jgi:hypothetical protein
MADGIFYKQISYFVNNYGKTGNPDQRNVTDFMECEGPEAVRSLQAELIGVTKGNYAMEAFDKLVGIARREKHGSYEDWAKAMLLWIVSFKG